MIKKFSKKALSFPVIYESATEGGYVVYAPALPGCHTQGETLEEAEKNIREAIILYVESMGLRREALLKKGRVLQGRVEVAV